jgi:hypothetical protein
MTVATRFGLLCFCTPSPLPQHLSRRDFVSSLLPL